MKNLPRKTSSSLLYQSLFGVFIEIIDAANSDYIGLSGIIVNETRQTFILRTKKNETKIIEKKSCLFKVSIPENVPIVIQGQYFIGRVDERIKKHSRRI